MTIARLTTETIARGERVSFIARTLKEVRRKDLVHGIVERITDIGLAWVKFDHDPKRYSRENLRLQCVRIKDLIPELK